MRYEVNAATIASEVIDGEAIIMDMASGVYHSATGIGAVVWQALLDKCDIDAIAAALTVEFPAQDTSGDLTRFIGELKDATLVREVPENGSDAAIDFADVAYAPPQLMSYGDMQDLIMLDPIHDVSVEHGWPVRPDPAGGSVGGGT